MAKDWSGDKTSPLAMGRNQRGSIANKKKKKEQKTGSGGGSQSSSVTQQQRINQKMYGQPTKPTYNNRSRNNTTQRRTSNTTAAQRQKMGMPTSEDLSNARTSRRRLATNTRNFFRDAMSEDSRSFAQRQKSGTLTAEDEGRVQKMHERRTDIVKNTGAAAKKAVLDTGSGYAQSLYDVTDLTASNKNGTRAMAMKMGIDPNKDKSRMAELERQRKYTAEESKRRRDALFSKQEQRQAEWDERTKNAKGLEKAWYGAVESGTGMLADTAVGAITGTGQFGALASMGLRTYGSSANQARKEGATDKEARLYGLASSAKEMGTELMFQGAGLAKAAYGGKAGLSLADKSANVLTRGLTGVKADIVGAGVRALGGTAEENAEELAGWMADPLIKELTYGKNVRNRMRENLRSNIPQIGSGADAAHVASYFSTPQFTDELTNEYVKSGMSNDKAAELADEMRDYYLAYYSNDTERLDELEDDLAAKLSGQDKLSFKSWSMDELKDTFASTTLLTLATGIPGAATTSVKGNQIFDSDEVKKVFGNDAVRKVADAVRNSSNGEMSLKADTMKDRLDSGKDLTGTQKYDLYQGYIEKVRDTEKKAAASYGVVENARKEQDLVPTVGVDRNGNRVFAKETGKAYNEKYASTELTVEAIKNYMESDNSISDDESRRADAVKKAVADIHVGGLTVGDAHEFAYGNELAREALKAEEGIDLDQYVVLNDDGTVNLPATNEATENALFQINADNAIQTAKAETEVFIDDTRGDIDRDILSRFGNNGQAVWKEVNKDLDPRDLNKYLTNANAASYFYSAGRNTDMSVDEAVNSYADTFKSVDKSVLKRAFAAGARDRIVANTPGYGQTVKAGSNIPLKKTKPILTGQLIMDKDVKISDSDQSAYHALAMATNTNIHIVSSLKSKNGVEINGMSHGNDIYLNMNAAAESNLGYVFMHEMTHQIKQYAPNEYLALENLVRDRWFNKDQKGMQKAIKDRIALYSEKGGQQLTEEEAVEEIIADAMAEAMDDPDFAAQVCEENLDLGQAILNSIKAALRSIRQMFANTEFRNDRFHNTLLSYLGILDDAEKMWLNALHTARQNKANGLIADWQDKANKQNSPRLSVGYHAGDLGKSTVDDYAHQGGSRGSGHFGFGTYFVGDEEQINYGDYGKRKHETVDFDKYNLFRPENFEQGLKLHDALKKIDGLIEEYSSYAKYKDSILNESLWNEEYYKSKSVNRDIERLVDDYEMEEEPNAERKDRIDKFISEMPEYYRNKIESEAEKNYNNAQSREVDEDEIRERLAQHYELFGSYLYDNVDDYVENNLESEINHINWEKEVPYDQWKYEAAKDVIKDYSENWTSTKNAIINLSKELVPALGYKHTESRIEDALLKTEEIVKGYLPEGGYRLNAEPGLDSGATVFMKQLGYEGVDVRHIPEMDNTGYGSVIYDLKGEDLARKQEIGTARFSISEAPSMEELDGSNSTIDSDNGEPVAQFYDDGAVSFSISSYESEGRKLYKDYLDKMVKAEELSQDEANQMLRELETIYDISKRFADQKDDNGDPLYAPYTAWSYADVVRDEKGKPVFSAIKKNSEYKMNIDFSTICKKRRTLDAVFREMIKRGLFEQLDLNKDESAALVVNINNLIRKNKFEAACALCFVEARRYRQQQTAKTFTNMWNGLVETMYKDKDKIAYFNFGRDDKAKDVPDGIHTMDDSQLDLSYVSKIANEKKDGKLKQTAEAKAARLILNDPNQRKLMRVGDMMASTGFENMQIENPELMKVYNSKKGTGGAKSSFGDVQYLNEMIRSKTFDRQKAYDVSGVRIQSFSDYVPRMVFDYVQVIADLAAKKLPAHAYTKEPLFVKQFGLSGVKINLSLVPDVVADSDIPGLDKDGNYVWNVEGTFPYDEAMKIQEAEGYKDNCGTIAVGISDKQIMKMLADPTIQMVIPYHKSSLNPIVAAMTNVDRFTNYEDFQNTKNAEGKAVKTDFAWDKKLFALTHYTRGEKKGELKPKEQWGNVQDLVKDYVKWCEDRKYTPKFSQFLYLKENNDPEGAFVLDDNGNKIINPGYYKMLEDFALLDNDLNFKPQGDVQMRFPTKESAFGSMEDLIKQGLSEDTKLEADRSAKIGGIVDEIENMMQEGTLTEQSATSEKLAAKFSISPVMDEQYMNAVNSGNMDEAQRLVDEAAKMAGYTTRAYHGTHDFGFTEFELYPENMSGIRHGNLFGDGFYFTSVRDVASDRYGYGSDEKSGVYDVYLDLGDSLTLDWNDVRKKFSSKRDLDSYLYREGKDKDSITVHNIMDGIDIESTVYVIKPNVEKGEGNYTSNRIKSADPVTYREDGSVIPLSERFDPTNNDIRYSLPTQDSDGNILTDGQMEYFKNSQARDALGRMQVVYHTTNYGGFTIFDPSYSDDKRSLFFASNFDVSQTYGTKKARKPIDLNPQLEREVVEYKDLTENDLMKMVNNHGDFRVWTQEEYDSYVPVGQESYHGYFYNPSIMDEFEKEYPDGNFAGGYRFYAYLKDLKEGKVKDDEYVLTYYDNPGHVYVKGKTMEELLKNLSQREYDKAVRAAEEEFRQRQIDARTGYYSCYLNLENPLIVDAQGHNWNDIPYGPEFDPNAWDNYIENLQEKYDRAVSSVRVVQDNYDDDGNPSSIWIEIGLLEKDADGNWIEDVYTDQVSINLEDYMEDGEVNAADASYALWDVADDSLLKAGLPMEYLNMLTADEIDFDGDIDYTAPDWDYIDAANNTYEKTSDWEEPGTSTYRTRELAEMAEAQGYDGVIIRDCVDIGGTSKLKIGASSMSDIYIAFSSNQVKDINNENPTENPDIRYSITPEDEAMSKMANDFAYDNSYERLAYYETILDESASEEAVYEKAKKYIAEDVDEFYAGLTRYADGMKFDDPVLEAGRVRMAKSKQDFFNSSVAKWNQNWLTNGEVLDIDSVKKPIKDLVMANMMESKTSKRYKADLVKKMAIDMRLAYFYAKQGRTDIADALLWHSAFRMVDGVEFYADDENFETYKRLRDYFRNTNIQLGEEYWSDTDYGAFRKANYGRINLVKGKTNLDKVLDDLYHENPDGSIEGIAVEWFSPEAFEKNDHKIDSVPDILLQIADVLDDVEPYAEAYSSDYCAEWATDLASSLLDIMASGKELQSTADKYKNRYEAKIKAMKARHAEAMLKVRQQRDQAVRRERVRLKEYVEKKKEQQAHKTYFDRIKETHDKLVERLSSNTADKHIPEQYKKSLAKLLAAFDLQTVGSKARQARTGHVAKNTIRLAAIREALKNIEDRTELFHVNDAITDLMDELSSVEGKTIDALSAAELWNIDRLLKSLLHEFNRYEKVRIGAKNLQAADLADAQVYSALEHAELFGPGNDYYGVRGWMDKIVNMDEMTPAYLFKMIDPDNVGLGLMWKEIRRSQDKYIRNTDQINKWVEEITGKYKNKGRFGKKYGSDEIEKWRSSNYIRTFELENGTVELTPAQMMSLYCLSKRNQAYGHMVGAGIVVAPVSFQAKMMTDLKKKINRSLPVILTDADIKTVVSQLTPEQVQVADQLQELMSTKMADLGNEASMNVLGIKLFNESDYFPIKSDKAALERDLTNEQFENAIRNFGFAKAVKPGARNAIMIEDIFDVVTEHCNNMNLYNSYSETLNDFMKVFNKHSIQENGADYSVRQALAHAYSQKATTFIMEFIRDLNGNVSRGRTTGIENAMNDMLARAKQASVFANLRVLVQQPTAITRAFAVIDPKYLKGVSLGDALKGMVPTVTTEAMQEMFDHCPIALWKSWGYYDINMGKSIESIIMNEGNWLEDVATQAYGKADNITWTAIWQMVKAETKDLHPELKEGTEEFWEHCNERMSEVVDLTQVVDSPLHRSHAMRAKDVFHKTFTAFMAEPTLTFNMIRDGYIRGREEWKKGNKKKAAEIYGRTASVAVLQAATVAAAAAVIDALRGKNPGGDDDEDKNLWLINFLNNLKDEMKIWNKIYYIKDLASIAEGWDNANLALQGWKTLTDGFRQYDKKLFEGSKVPWWKIYYNLLGGIGYFTGIPFKTLMKDGRAIFELLGGQLPESLVGEEKSESVVSSDSKLQSLRLFGGNNTNKSSSSTTVVKVDTGEKWYDYENNPITVRDGSPLDKLLNRFGVNLTAAEKAAIAKEQEHKEREDKAQEIADKYADLSGEERDKKVWGSVTSYLKDKNDGRGIKAFIAEGDYGTIRKYRQMYIDAGGSEEYFDERVISETKSALKKTIAYEHTDDELYAQQEMKAYLQSNGVTDAEISEMVYKSDLAKDLKVAMRLGDEQLVNEALIPLVQAGLSREDFDKLWKNRNRLDLNKYKGRYKDKLKSTGNFIWPTDGVITSHFGYRNAPTAGASSNHPAIDIGAPQGTAVVAADGGVVISAGANGGYGNSVGIKHDNGMITWYNHLYSWNVKEGDTVAQGQQIAQVGSTGISTGPHLDFKIMNADGEPVDPEKYLAAR